MSRALLWSLALHGLLLWPAPVRVLLPGVAREGEVLQARLRQPAIVNVAPASTLSAAEERGTVRRETAEREKKSNRAVGAVAPVRTAADRTDTRSVSGAGADAEGLRAYRLALAVQARPHWHYPEDALRAGLVGTAYVRVALLIGGGMLVSLERSSGHPSLDGAAMDMLRAAVRSTALPESLRDQSFALVMPVVFEQPSADVR